MEKLRNAIKNISPKKFLYPGIFFLYIITVGILFFFSTRSLVSEVNKALATQTDEGEFSFDMGHYNLIAARLNLPVQPNVENPETATTTSVQIETTATTSPDTKKVLPKK